MADVTLDPTPPPPAAERDPPAFGDASGDASWAARERCDSVFRDAEYRAAARARRSRSGGASCSGAGRAMM